MRASRAKGGSNVLRRSRAKGAAAVAPRGSPKPNRQVEASDAYVGKQKRKELMDNALRVSQQAGARPPPQMRARPQARLLDDAEKAKLAEGVVHRTISSSADDPAVTISRIDVAIGSATPERRSETDQRLLVEGSGTALLNGVTTQLSAGDMVLVPRGTKVGFMADRGETLRLWAATSPGADGAKDAPMTRAAGVLSEDNSKEFFVGEGVHILERANDAQDPAVGFDRVRAPPGMTTARHKLNVDERYLITRGEGTVEVDGKRYPVKPGDVVLIPAGSAQRIEAGNTGVDFYVITTPRFLVDDYAGHLDDAFFHNPTKYDGSAGPRAEVEAKISSS